MAEPQDTVVERTGVGPSPASAPSVPPSGIDASLTAPSVVLHHEEVQRTRRVLVVLMAIAAVGMVTVPILDGDPLLMKVLVVAAGVAFIGCWAFRVYLSDPARYSPRKAMLPALLCLVAAGLGLIYIGPFSAAAMNFTLGIYFFGLSTSWRMSFLAYFLTAGVQGLLMILLAVGVLPDRGIIGSESLTLTQKLGVAFLVESALFLTWAAARQSRHATVAAIEGLDQALRQVAQREALLQEANRELERLAAAGGPAVGERAGSWLLGELLGRGGMGEVYAAVHEKDGREAAVKVLSKEATRDPDRFARFLRESAAMSQLHSPHVVEVLDAGGSSSGRPYIAMTRLRGHDLSSLLRRRRRLGAEEAAELVRQVAQALEAARKAEVVHRDLKPQNVFYDEGTRLWKVLDFGVSKLGTSSGTLTRGLAIGTPGYMSPEQATGTEVDHRADVFALSLLAYRALTGRPAFYGDEQPKIMFDIVYRQPAQPTTFVDLHEDVDRALALGLAKKPDDRFATAEAFAKALADAVVGKLDPALAAKADDLLARQPWGRRVV